MRIGCVGFPVGQERYWSRLSFLETDTGKGFPQLKTLEAWRAGMPVGAMVSVQASRLITHGPDDRGFPENARKLPDQRRRSCGFFHDSLEVHEAWMATKAAASALNAAIVVFETPLSFHPDADRLRDMYRFFKAAARGRLTFVWSARGREWSAVADKVCADLGLIWAFDPLRREPPKKGQFLYMRPVLARQGSLSHDEQSTIIAAGAGVPSFVALSHRAAFADAENLAVRAR